jgi:peptidoglycan/LPS O-acetylase OafA/YrhL
MDELMFVPIFHLSTFLIGIALARWQTLNELRIQSWSNGIVSSLLLIAAAAAALFLLWPDLFAIQFVHDGLLAPIWALAILIVSINGKWPAEFFGNRILRELGDASYALYLYQVPILHIVQRLHLPHTWTIYALYLFFCIGISVLSFRYFETPWRIRITKWFARTGSSARASTPQTT